MRTSYFLYLLGDSIILFPAGKHVFHYKPPTLNLTIFKQTNILGPYSVIFMTSYETIYTIHWTFAMLS